MPAVRRRGRRSIPPLMPASAISLPHFALSLWMNFANASAEVGAGSAPRTRIFSIAAGSLNAFTKAAFNVLMMSGERAGGRDDPKPADGSESAQALLGQRGHIGQKDDALGGGDPERLQLAVADQLPGCGNIQHRQRDVAGKHVRRRRRGAAIGDQLNSDAGLLVEQGRGQVHRRAVAAMADRQALRLRLGLGDEVCDRGNGRLLRGHQHERDFRQQRDRRQILTGSNGIAARLRWGLTVSTPAAAHAERVTVRRGLRHGPDPDIAARACPVLDDNRLTQRLRRAPAAGRGSRYRNCRRAETPR